MPGRRPRRSLLPGPPLDDRARVVERRSRNVLFEDAVGFPTVPALGAIAAPAYEPAMKVSTAARATSSRIWRGGDFMK